MAKYRTAEAFLMTFLVLITFSISQNQVPPVVDTSSHVEEIIIENGKTRNWSHSASVLESVFIRTAALHKSKPQPQVSHGPLRSRRGALPSRTRASYTPLNVTVNGKSCILFWAKKLEIKLKDHTQLDLTGRIFGPNAKVNLKSSTCSEHKAMLVLKLGDVEDLKDFVIRLLMSNTYYESAGQNWFSLDSVHILYNKTSEVRFNATEIYAPATSSYHCQHVSSLQKYDTLLVPSTQADGATLQHVTFTDFQIQAFSIQDGQFASATDCASFFTPAILMGLIMSLILLLVLAYALHMVVHLKSIERYDEHKTVYFPKTQSSDSGEKSSL